MPSARRPKPDYRGAVLASRQALSHPAAGLRHSQAGCVPGIPHFAKWPFASRHLLAAAGADAHLMNLPLASRQGAAEALPAARAAAMLRAVSRRMGSSDRRRGTRESASVQALLDNPRAHSVASTRGCRSAGRQHEDHHAQCSGRAACSRVGAGRTPLRWRASQLQPRRQLLGLKRLQPSRRALHQPKR